MRTAAILLDSRHPHTRERLTTFQLTYPRFIHSEMMTHRCKSINSASSRAIPVSKMQEAVTQHGDDVVEFWGKNQSGMQATEHLDSTATRECRKLWRSVRREVQHAVDQLISLGCHKQIANRWLEPASHITVIATFPERGLRNFFGLRANPQAQPEFQCLAYDMLDAWTTSGPQLLDVGMWHMPMVEDVMDAPVTTQLKIATGRIARVSYLTHDGIRDPNEDVKLHDRLVTSGHWSPFEHCAQAVDSWYNNGNFGAGWKQYRKTFGDELRLPSDRDLGQILLDRPEWTKPHHAKA